jgi:hypothetical protein
MICAAGGENALSLGGTEDREMKKLLLIGVFGLALLAPAAQAGGGVFVHFGPPPPPREVVIVRPGPRYVWVPGYYRWTHGHYRWVRGRWVLPPRRGVVWVPGRWVPERGGFVWIAGYWR